MGISADERQLGQLERYAEILATRGIDEGLIGPGEAPAIVSRHILESAALVPHMSPGRLIDVGSGAGLPGLVLAVLGFDAVLLDSRDRRVGFLASVANELQVPVAVVHGRAEDVSRETSRESFDGAVARALADLPIAFELCLPFVRIGGRLLILASRSPDPSGDGTEATLQEVSGELGGGPPRWQELLVPGASVPRWAIMVEKIQPTPERFPRRPGVPKRRPLGGDVASVN